MLALVLFACAGTTPDSDTVRHTDAVETDTDGPSPTKQTIIVTVTLDGAPVAGASVLQGGAGEHHETDASGKVTFDLDLTILGDIAVVAGTPGARQKAESVGADDSSVTVALTSYGPDNPAYTFLDPGTPSTGLDTSQCSHCHRSLSTDWYDSAHRQSANNPRLWDVYTGTGGVLQTLNTCGTTDCADATAFGACADCHAPGIDGVLGGRDLREATGLALDFGVHCDVCHRVDRVDATGEAGVAGRLVMTRPSEEGRPGLGTWLPLTFGPWDDAPNIKMGSVQRDHFTDGALCSGCHQLDQPALVPGTALDPARWPTGRIPVHSTYEEWKAGPQGSNGVSCNACHMPPDPTRGNGIDLGSGLDVDPGLAGGWFREPGAVHRHSWYGPRQRGSKMLELAAAVQIEKSVAGGVVTAEVTVRNVGCGHALPTGDPMRQVMLLVEATCGTEAQPAIGGDVVPDLGGWLDRRTSDFSRWPGASVGDVIRVGKIGDFLDYPAVAPFDSFSAAQKGLRATEIVGEARIRAVDGDEVTFDRALPAGDVAWRVRNTALPTDGSSMQARAGAPGFLFARVTAGKDGTEGVPHHAATDIVRDNRLPPQGQWTSTHRFAATCADPTVTAVLVHRAAPYELQAARGWADVESVMSRVVR